MLHIFKKKSQNPPTVCKFNRIIFAKKYSPFYTASILAYGGRYGKLTVEQKSKKIGSLSKVGINYGLTHSLAKQL